MLLLILGEHEMRSWKEIKEKAGRVFSHPPLGVRVLHQYVTLSGDLTFTIIEAEEAEEVAKLMAELSGLSKYEVYPIYEVEEGEKVETGEGYFDPMHGPI
ncbi:MAG: hypothetical protein JRI46_01280 [Deltaproteobacteria bacterium]|nr:hypothetical protein [Deltaproteobacteria bacterium]